MTTWDSVYCVALWKEYAGIQSANELNDTTDICPSLSRGQERTVEMIAQRFPNALYQAPIALTPSADRKTFSYGTDAQGNAIVSLGYTQISTSLNAFVGPRFFNGWVEGRDFLDEGDHIRICGNRSYGGTLYARFVPTPPDVTLAVNMILNPAAHRELAVVQGVLEWARSGNQRPDIVQNMKEIWADAFPRAMLTYKKRFTTGGGLIDPARWYFAAPDLGRTSG